MIDFTHDSFPQSCLRHRLEVQSRLIEAALTPHSRRRAKVMGGRVDDDAIRYDVLLGGDSAVFPLRAGQQALANRLGEPVQLTRETQGLTAAVARHRPPVRLMDMLAQYTMPADGSLTAVLGIDQRGEMITFSFQGAANLLLYGMADSGRSALLRTLLISLALGNRPSQAQFLIIQASDKRELSPLNYLPASYLLHPVIHNADEAARALNKLAARLGNSVNGRAAPQIIIVIDDALTLLESQGIEALTPLTRLLTGGSGVSLILSADRPDNDLLRYWSGSFTARLTGKVANAAQARAAVGLPNSGAERFLGRGDFILTRRDGTNGRYFQAAYQDQYEMSFLLSLLREGMGGNGRLSYETWTGGGVSPLPPRPLDMRLRIRRFSQV